MWIPRRIGVHTVIHGSGIDNLGCQSPPFGAPSSHWGRILIHENNRIIVKHLYNMIKG